MSGITVTCFAASYAVALGLEASRLLFRSGVRGVVMLGFAGAGLLAHSLFLASRLTRYEAGGVTGWFEWFLLAAWILAATYLYLTYYHPRYPFGLFVLPLVLTLIGIGYSLRLQAGFLGGARVWGLIHGWSLLLGTVIVLIGFVAGLMYLIEANRLKQKRPPASRFRLPSLEWAERVNGRTLVLSTILLGVGVLSGLALNAINHVRGDSAMPWSDPGCVEQRSAAGLAADRCDFQLRLPPGAAWPEGRLPDIGQHGFSSAGVGCPVVGSLSTSGLPGGPRKSARCLKSF